MRPTHLNFDVFLTLKGINRPTFRQTITFNKGIYFWFATFEALEKMGITKIKNWQEEIYQKNDHYLVYIGIGPRNENTKKQFLPQRIANCHFGNKITNSTFRLSIASVLSKEGFTKEVGENLKYFIDNNEEAAISKFLENNFCVGLIDDKAPWLKEKPLIHKFQPPLNLQHNAAGWFYKTMNQSRKAFQAKAKSIKKTSKSLSK
jgi:hypothetical protein